MLCARYQNFRFQSIRDDEDTLHHLLDRAGPRILENRLKNWVQNQPKILNELLINSSCLLHIIENNRKSVGKMLVDMANRDE